MRKTITEQKPKFPLVELWDWEKAIVFTLFAGEFLELELEGEKFSFKLLTASDGKARVSFLYKPNPSPPKWYVDEKNSSPKPMEKLPDCFDIQNLMLIEDGNILLGDLQ